MRMSRESFANQINAAEQIDNLVRVLKGQNADPRAVDQCLGLLASILGKLDDPMAQRRVRKYLARNEADQST